MNNYLEPTRSQPPAAFFPTPFISRLGGIAGLLGVLLAFVQGAGLADSIPAVKMILQVIPNLVIVVWLFGVYAFQSPHLGRLGLLGMCASTAGFTIITLFNLIRTAAQAGSASWANILLSSPATTLFFTLVAVIIVWGTLAFGTTSLQTGMLPRGAVVLWMVGLMALLISSWLPVSLVAMTGIIWSSIILLRGVRVKDASSLAEVSSVEHATATKVSSTGRFIPLDALRGVIMILMAIDHASFFIRHWHPFETWDQPLPDYPSLAAMLTRLATHPCAPGFFFLMGAGMVLFANSRRKLGWSERRIAGTMALRGLLFIVLEQLIVDVATAGQVYPFEFSILSGLGVVMLLGILFLRLKGSVQVAAGAVILLVMQLLPGLLLNADLGIFNPVRLLILPGSVGVAFVLYPPIPWLGVALLGMAFTHLLQTNADKAYKVSGIVGLVCLALFPLVRALGGFGNLRMPPGSSFIDFFNLVKYPPSLSFLLLTLGFDLVLLYLFSRISIKLATWGRPVVILGRAALYFFLVHWFVYAAMGLVWNSPDALPQTYLGWFAGLILLYPVCKTYEAFKHKMPVTSVWRMV
jgi:uncharacterized membrane protein